MKLRSFLPLLFIVISLQAFSQNKNLYGPLPYHTPAETIGETYIVIPLMDGNIEIGYSLLYKIENGYEKKISAKEGRGKLLKLVSIDNHNSGHFVDSLNAEYTSFWDEKSLEFSELAYYNDLIDARKLFLNKTLWLNRKKLNVGDPLSYAAGKDDDIYKMRF